MLPNPAASATAVPDMVAKIELAELERLKTDFIAITSHELRTPLGLILGHATFLRELAGTQFGEQLETIIRNATRLKEIVENLSDVDNYQNGSARVRGDEGEFYRGIGDVYYENAGREVSWQDQEQQRMVNVARVKRRRFIFNCIRVALVVFVAFLLIRRYWRE